MKRSVFVTSRRKEGLLACQWTLLWFRRQSGLKRMGATRFSAFCKPTVWARRGTLANDLDSLLEHAMTPYLR